MRSPFASMAVALSVPPRTPWPGTPASAPRDPGASRTESIRQLLRERGSMSALAVALELELPSPSLVGALLKADLHAGRAFHRGGEYHWDHTYDEQLAREIAEAIHLLKKHGYSVERISA